MASLGPWRTPSSRSRLDPETRLQALGFLAQTSGSFDLSQLSDARPEKLARAIRMLVEARSPELKAVLVRLISEQLA